MLFHLDVHSTNKQETLTGCRLATNQRAKRARWGRAATERTTNERRSIKVDLIRLNFNFRWEKNYWRYDIWCVGSGVKYHSLPYWSICYDASRIQFRANQPGKKKLLESLDRMFLLYTIHVKVLKARAQNFVAWIELLEYLTGLNLNGSFWVCRFQSSV